MPRLNIDRQQKIEPQRMAHAKTHLQAMGYEIVKETATTLQFKFKGNTVTYYAYSGWATGKSIRDGRGWQHLYEQICPTKS